LKRPAASGEACTKTDAELAWSVVEKEIFNPRELTDRPAVFLLYRGTKITEQNQQGAPASGKQCGVLIASKQMPDYV